LTHEIRHVSAMTSLD